MLGDWVDVEKHFFPVDLSYFSKPAQTKCNIMGIYFCRNTAWKLAHRPWITWLPYCRLTGISLLLSLQDNKLVLTCNLSVRLKKTFAIPKNIWILFPNAPDLTLKSLAILWTHSTTSSAMMRKKNKVRYPIGFVLFFRFSWNYSVLFD